MDGSLNLHATDSSVAVFVAPPGGRSARGFSATTKSSQAPALEKPAPAKKKRPLSPICPYTSVEEIPKPFGRFRNSAVWRILPFVVSFTIHASILTYAILGYRAMQRPKLSHVIEGALAPTIDPAPVTVAVAMPIERDATRATNLFPKPEIEEPAMREPEDREQSALNDAVSAPARIETPQATEAPVELGISATSDLPKPIHRAIAPLALAQTSAEKIEPLTASFFGVTGNARSVVYLCDASGSMLGTSDTITTQLQRAIIALSPSQEFNLVMFSDSAHPATFNHKQLVSADANNKLAACAFAKSLACKGKTDAVSAIEAALRFKPDMIYLVTDGEFDEQDEQVMTTIRTANADHRTTINVLLISGAANPDEHDLSFLSTLAKESSGTCRVINPNTN